MPYVNKIEIMGNLGKDPELRHLPDQTPTTRISVAVKEKWRNKQSGEPEERTEWFRAVLYGSQAERVCSYMKKGDCIQLWGKLQTRPYQDRQGHPQAITEIVVSEMQIIYTKAKAGETFVEGGLHDMM